MTGKSGESSGAKSRSDLQQKVIIGLLLGLLIVIMNFAMGVYQIYQVHNMRSLVDYSHSLLRELDGLLVSIKELESGQHGYALTGSSDFLETHSKEASRLEERLAELEGLSKHNPEQAMYLPALKKNIENKIRFTKQVIAAREEKGTEAVTELVRSGKGMRLMEAIRNDVEAMKAVEESLMLSNMGVRLNASQHTTVAFVLVSILAVAALVSLIYFVKRYIRERFRVQKQLEHLSATDDLTGLYNKRGFFSLLEPFIDHAVEDRSICYLLFVDMDGLKKINDSQGHDAGSAAISAIAHVLKQKFRDHDLVARWGGDEFVVLAAANAQGLGEMLVERVEQALRLKQRTEKLPYELSASIGVLTVEPEKASPEQIEELIGIADERMYEEKRRKKKVRQ